MRRNLTGILLRPAVASMLADGIPIDRAVQAYRTALSTVQAPSAAIDRAALMGPDVSPDAIPGALDPIGTILPERAVAPCVMVSRSAWRGIPANPRNHGERVSGKPLPLPPDHPVAWTLVRGSSDRIPLTTTQKRKARAKRTRQVARDSRIARFKFKTIE